MSDEEERNEVRTERKDTGGAKRAAGRRKPAARKSQQVIRIRLARSLIGRPPHQRAVVAGLGLRRLNQVVERENTREIQGMIAKVSHLVDVIS